MQIIHYTDTKRLQASLLNIQSNQSHFYFYRTKEHAQHRRAASRPRSDAMLLCSKREDAALASSALWGECRLIVWNDQRNKPHILAVWKASPERISGALSPPLSPPNAPPLPSLPLPLLSFEAPSLSSSQGAQKGGCRRGSDRDRAWGCAIAAGGCGARPRRSCVRDHALVRICACGGGERRRTSR